MLGGAVDGGRGGRGGNKNVGIMGIVKVGYGLVTRQACGISPHNAVLRRRGVSPVPRRNAVGNACGGCIVQKSKQRRRGPSTRLEAAVKRAIACGQVQPACKVGSRTLYGTDQATCGLGIGGDLYIARVNAVGQRGAVSHAPDQAARLTTLGTVRGCRGRILIAVGNIHVHVQVFQNDGIDVGRSSVSRGFETKDGTYVNAGCRNGGINNGKILDGCSTYDLSAENAVAISGCRHVNARQRMSVAVKHAKKSLFCRHGKINARKIGITIKSVGLCHSQLAAVQLGEKAVDLLPCGQLVRTVGIGLPRRIRSERCCRRRADDSKRQTRHRQQQCKQCGKQSLGDPCLMDPDTHKKIPLNIIFLVCVTAYTNAVLLL